jgi:hypothetical protein
MLVPEHRFYSDFPSFPIMSLSFCSRTQARPHITLVVRSPWCPPICWHSPHRFPLCVITLAFLQFSPCYRKGIDWWKSPMEAIWVPSSFHCLRGYVIPPCFIYLVSGIRASTQGPTLARQALYHLNHTSSPFLFWFSFLFFFYLTCWPGWP